jgi:hypothetical protein
LHPTESELNTDQTLILLPQPIGTIMRTQLVSCYEPIAENCMNIGGCSRNIRPRKFIVVTKIDKTYLLKPVNYFPQTKIIISKSTL